MNHKIFEVNILRIHRQAVFLAALAYFAVAAPNALNAQETEDEDDIFRLSPFEVNEEAGSGYHVPGSAGSSRLAFPSTEIPQSVVSLNQRVMEDTVALNLGDLSSLVAGVGPPTGNSQLRNTLTMRGFSVGVGQRDGIPDRTVSSVGGFDTGLMERIEFIKGPSGILFGSTSPGGIINTVSKRPLPVEKTKIRAMIGSHNTRRFEFDRSGFFGIQGEEFGYRVALVTKDTDGPTDFPREPSLSFESFYGINPSISYEFENGPKLWLWGMFVDDGSNRMNVTAHAFRTGPDTGRVLFDEAKLGPGNNIFTSLNKQESDTVEFGLTHSIDITERLRTDIRFVARDFELFSDSSRIRGVGPGVDWFFDADGNVIGNDSRTVDFDEVKGNLAFNARKRARFDFRPSNESGQEYAADFNFNFDLDLPAIGTTTFDLLTFGTWTEISTESQNDRFELTDPDKILSFGGIQLDEGVFIRTKPNPEFDATPQQMMDLADFSTERGTVNNEESQYSVGFLGRMALWNDRIHIVGAVSQDETDGESFQVVNDQVTDVQSTDDSQTLHSIAGIVKVYKEENNEVSLFYNDNRTFIPVFQTDTRLETFGERFPNRIASTEEAGIKAELFDRRLTFTAPYFDVTETNVLLQFEDKDGSVTGEPPPTTFLAPVGERRSDGFEFDSAWSPLPGWDMIISYSNFDSQLEDGNRSANVPDETFSILSRYEFQDGPLGGASLAWIYNYWGGSILRPDRTGWPIPSGWVHTAVVGYRWDRMRLDFRIENVFDELKARPATFETAVPITPGRNFRAALTYEF